jgi:hypothetical protein
MIQQPVCRRQDNASRDSQDNLTIGRKRQPLSLKPAASPSSRADAAGNQIGHHLLGIFRIGKHPALRRRSSATPNLRSPAVVIAAKPSTTVAISRARSLAP